MGHQLVLNPNLSERFVAYPTWTVSLSPEEDIQSVLPAFRGPVASIGKVLGNRTTLYKYLNPRLFTVLTASHLVSPPSCGIYLIDSTKGTIIYHATVPAGNGACDVKAVITENWLVYHYFDDKFSGTGKTKGYRMVTVELYEGSEIDDKTKRYGCFLHYSIPRYQMFCIWLAPTCHPSPTPVQKSQRWNNPMYSPMASQQYQPPLPNTVYPRRI